jgi:hypothetical protein
MKTVTLLIMMLLPGVMTGQVTTRANVSATIISYDLIEQIPDSVNLHFRVQGTGNFLINLTIMNEYGKTSTDIISLPSTDLFIPGRKTPGMTLLFNYN